MPEEIPVGPQHPALKEPANFMLTVEGEHIVDAELSISYNHRGLEKTAESRSYLDDIYLLERMCGICSHSHTYAFTRATEQLANLRVPPRAQYIRALVGELERLHSHLLWLGVAGHEMGFDTLWNHAWKDRETVLDLLEEIAGDRVHYSVNTIGGVTQDLQSEVQEDVLDAIDDLHERAERYKDLVLNEETVRLRCEDVGTISQELAVELCATGPTARASGVATDMRAEAPYGPYDDLDFDIPLGENGDLLDRVLVRAEDLVESCKIIRQLVADLPRTKLTATERNIEVLASDIDAGEVISRYEAPRGELTHFVRSDGSDVPARVKVRPPTHANWPTVVEGLRGGSIADTPMVVAGIDPCISCTSRIGVEIDDHADGDDDKMTLGELSEYADEYYGDREVRADGGGERP